MKLYVKSSTDDSEIYDEGAVRRVSSVIKNLDKGTLRAIASDVMEYYQGKDGIFYEELKDDIYHDLRNYVCRLAKVDYTNYDLGEDNYDDLVEIAIELTYEMAQKYEIDLIGE